MHNFLDFERPIAELEAKIEELARMGDDVSVNISGELRRLQSKSRELTMQIFADLTPWQITQLARHPLRPHTLDYVSRIFTDFDELHGDRHYVDDKAIVGGLAFLEGRPVMIIGHEKGRKTKEKVERNFGMPQPEGYRKALRLMHLAEDFNLPVLTFIDTAGAYPNIAAEEHNQSEAIARNLYELAGLKTPVICTVIGEGGSGGALALGVGDYVMMLQYSIYSVISPEGCASILWKSAEKASEAAGALKLNAESLLKQQLIDKVLPEPLGGAHRHIDEMAQHLKTELILQLDRVSKKPIDQLLSERYERLMSYGQRVIQ
jgi:acetyl-CoA carboxylase carboxyl transferase subunit alpha